MTTIAPPKKSKLKKPTALTAAAPAATVAAPGTDATPAPSPVPVAFVVQAPPPTVIPAVPADFSPVDIAYYVGVLPKASQRTAMTGAVQELKDFTDYGLIFGKTAPPLASVLQAFDIANQWSSLRAKMDTFDVFCQSQEALSWNEVHDYMATMQGAFALAVKSDPQIGKEHPSLVGLFTAQKQIAQKAVSTRKANKELVAQGKLPIKGKVGKRRRSVAAKALFDAANSAATASAPTTSAPATPPAPPAPTAPATNGATTGPAGTNGTPHA
jgi:hypothetical protein